MSEFDYDADEVGRIFGRGRRRRRNRRLRRRAARSSHSDSAASPRAGRTAGRRLMASRQRVQPFGMGVLTMLASASGSLTAVCQKPTQFDRLILSSDDLDSITVTDIKVGTRSQLAGVSAVPGNMFQPDATVSSVVLDPVGTGQSVTIDFTNLDAANPHTVQAGFYGAAAE